MHVVLTDEKTVLSCSVRGGGDGLSFLDAMLAFRVQKLGSLIRHDNKPFLTVREVEMLTSCCERASVVCGLLNHHIPQPGSSLLPPPMGPHSNRKWALLYAVISPCVTKMCLSG